MGVNVDERDISVSHRLPVSKIYSGKENLKGITTKNLGYQTSNNIYINESLTDTNRKLFKDCLKLKKELGYQIYLDQKWKDLSPQR
jgi:hypothetical protein